MLKKFPFFRILVLFTLFSLNLAACNAAPSVTPTAAMPLETPRPTAGPQATATPEVPASPTKEAVDPNAPPEGTYTRHENGVYYLDKKTAGGNTITSSWDAERKIFTRVIFSGYAGDQSKIYNDNNASWSKDYFKMEIRIDSAIPGEMSIPTLSHPDNTDPINTLNFSMNMDSRMIEALIRYGVIKGVQDFNFGNVTGHEYHLIFTNADGPQDWDLASDIKVVIRGDYAALKADTTNGFHETKKTTYAGPANSYMVKISTDTVTHGLVVEIAPSLPASEWTPDLFYEMGFWWIDVFESPDQTKPESWSLLSGIMLNKERFPYFSFGPPIP